jgi:hypothetical protein
MYIILSQQDANNKDKSDEAKVYLLSDLTT